MSTATEERKRVSSALGSQRIGIEEVDETPEGTVPQNDSTPTPAQGTKQSSKKKRQRKVVGPRHVRPEPRIGWPRALWHIKRFFSKFALLLNIDYRITNPKLNREDDDRQAIERLSARLVELSRDRKRNIAVMNWKGGAAKTPTACYAAFILEEVTGDSTIVLEMNENNGTARHYFGFRPGETLSLAQAIEHRKELVDYGAYLRLGTNKHPRGVRLIYAAEDISKENIPLEHFVELEENTSDAFHNTISDTGNGMKFQSNIASVNQADVIIVSSLFSEEQKMATVDGIAATIFALRQHGYGEKLLKRGVFVVNGTSPKDTRDSVYDEVAEIIFKSRDKRSDDVKDPAARKLMGMNIMRYLGIDRERFFVIPFSPHITNLETAVPTPESLGLSAYRGYLETLVCSYETPVESDPVTPAHQSSEFESITEDDSHWLESQFGPRPDLSEYIADTAEVPDQETGHN